MTEGKVKWFNKQKGFGYIEKSDGGEVFFDQTVVQETDLEKLSFGKRIIFDIVHGPRGSEAGEIKML